MTTEAPTGTVSPASRFFESTRPATGAKSWQRDRLSSAMARACSVSRRRARASSISSVRAPSFRIASCARAWSTAACAPVNAVLSAVELGAGDYLRLIQVLGAVEIPAGRVDDALGRLDGGQGLVDVLAARAFDHQPIAGVGRRPRGRGAFDLQAVLAVVEAGDRLTLVDQYAFVHEALEDRPRHFEGDVHFGHFDDAGAGDAARDVALRCAPPPPADGAGHGHHHQREPHTLPHASCLRQGRDGAVVVVVVHAADCLRSRSRVAIPGQHVCSATPT